MLEAATVELPATLKKSNECPVCGGAMEALIDLPRYPLTEMYEQWTPQYEAGRGLVDQAFLFCEPCSHGKLETVVPPAVLYGPGYRTRTAASSGAFVAVMGFKQFIRKHVNLEVIDVVIDIGGNDGSLLDGFTGKRTVAVDPHASRADVVIRAMVEDADLLQFKGERKLIVSSHTIEHIADPNVMLAKIAETMTYADTVALQFPSLDLLVRDCRIDHIHHQHLHYYSERSICALLGKHGLEVIAAQFDPMHYGALMVIARRGGYEELGMRITVDQIRYSHSIFMHNMTGVNVELPRYHWYIAFGAALMLPILAYYLPDLHQGTDHIADNDRSKNGLRYINFDRPIRCDYDLEGRDVVITGIATKMAARSLVTEAIAKGAKNVIVPLHTL